jgi:hypothetical protein
MVRRSVKHASDVELMRVVAQLSGYGPTTRRRDRPRRAREHEADRDSLKNPISPAVTRAGVHAPVNLSIPAR